MNNSKWQPFSTVPTLEKQGGDSLLLLDSEQNEYIAYYSDESDNTSETFVVSCGDRFEPLVLESGVSIVGWAPHEDVDRYEEHANRLARVANSQANMLGFAIVAFFLSLLTMAISVSNTMSKQEAAYQRSVSDTLEALKEQHKSVEDRCKALSSAPMANVRYEFRGGICFRVVKDFNGREDYYESFNY